MANNGAVAVQQGQQGQVNGAVSEVDRLTARVAELEVAASQPMRIHIGPKGTVVVTGIGSRYGVALYQESWNKLLAFAPKIAAFIAANSGKLARKGVEYVAPEEK